jgi:hypothetical protein
LGIAFGGTAAAGLVSGVAGATSAALVLCGGGERRLNIGVIATIGAFAGGPQDAGAIESSRGNAAVGAYGGFGLAGLVSPNATKVSDFGKAFRSEALNLGLGPLNGSVEYSSGVNDAGRAIDVITVTPPFASAGLGASYSVMTTWTFTRGLWSQKSSPQ